MQQARNSRLTAGTELDLASLYNGGKVSGGMYSIKVVKVKFIKILARCEIIKAPLLHDGLVHGCLIEQVSPACNLNLQLVLHFGNFQSPVLLQLLPSFYYILQK